MAAMVGAAVCGTLWTIFIMLVRPTLRFRERDRWLARPVAEVIGSTAFTAEVTPVVDRAEQEVRSLGFEPFVTFRMRLGCSGGRTVWRFHSLWRREATLDLACIDWEQWKGIGATWTTPVALNFVRKIVPDARLTRRIVLADRAASRDLVWSAENGAIADCYARLTVDGQSTTAQPWSHADSDAYLAAVSDLTVEHRASQLRDQARLDPTGQWFIYTWRFSLRSVLKHQFGRASSPTAGRGFEVVPAKSMPRDN